MDKAIRRVIDIREQEAMAPRQSLPASYRNKSANQLNSRPTTSRPARHPEQDIARQKPQAAQRLLVYLRPIIRLWRTRPVTSHASPDEPTLELLWFLRTLHVCCGTC